MLRMLLTPVQPMALPVQVPSLLPNKVLSRLGESPGNAGIAWEHSRVTWFTLIVTWLILGTASLNRAISPSPHIEFPARLAKSREEMSVGVLCSFWGPLYTDTHRTGKGGEQRGRRDACLQVTAESPHKTNLQVPIWTSGFWTVRKPLLAL